MASHRFPLLLTVMVGLLLTSESTPDSTPGINSNSVLVGLLESSYTSFSELLEKALLLPKLETILSTHHNVTILAPTNAALEMDPTFRSFLLLPSHLPSLQSFLLHHVLPSLHLLHSREVLQYRDVDVVEERAIVRVDGVVHGIGKVVVPRDVEAEFNRRGRSLTEIQAVLPEGAPEVDPRTHRLKKPVADGPAGSEPALPIYQAMAPGPDIAPAPAPGPDGPHGHFDGISQVKDFIHTLLHYGGYNEFSDILVNLTSLATEMGRLVSAGYVLTVLAPNDEAMAKLTTDQLSEPGAPEQIIYYHLIPEYQTEESMYNAVRRFGKVRYDTLRLPHKVVAREADGSVKFGQGEGSAYLFDPDIYTDGRISVQGVDAVLFPPEEIPSTAVKKMASTAASTTMTPTPRRGKLMEAACGMMGAFGQRSKFLSCN